MTRKAAIIGGGVIGGGWAARFLLNGWDVAVFDPDPQAQRKIEAVLANARRSLPALYDRPLPDPGTLSFETDLAACVSEATWVQESVPERLEIKHKVLADLTAHAPAQAIIGSSTSGFKPSDLTRAGARAIVAHPFNPVYLLPLVELVGAADACTRAAQILRDIGMHPLVLRKEVDAHIADRLLEAVWRESLWLVKDGIATTAEIDDAIRMGFGLRWAQMGLFETYRIAGGEAGMRHFLAQFGPALAWPWTKLMDVPDLDDDLVDLIAGQSDVQSGHLSIRDLERVRDDNLVGILRALKRGQGGAGKVVAAHEGRLHMPRDTGLPVTVHRQVPAGWTDQNGHINEAHYLELSAQATDRFLETVGCDADYIAGGAGYFTAETHIRFIAELREADMVTVTTQLLLGAGKKLHLFHRLNGPDGRLAATVETFLLHMDLERRRSSLPAADVTARLAKIAAAHGSIPVPDGAGRFVGQRT